MDVAPRRVPREPAGLGPRSFATGPSMSAYAGSAGERGWRIRSPEDLSGKDAPPG